MTFWQDSFCHDIALDIPSQSFQDQVNFPPRELFLLCRFEHSIGVAYLAYTFAYHYMRGQDNLNLTYHDLDLVQIAGKGNLV